jgi:hypothetical protein
MGRAGLLLLAAGLAGCTRMGFRPPEDGPVASEGRAGELGRLDLPDAAADGPTSKDGWDLPRHDGPSDGPRPEAPPKPDGPAADGPAKLDGPGPDAPRLDLPRPDAPRPDQLQPDAPKPDQGGVLVAWWNTAFAHRLELTLSSSAPVAAAPVFLSGAKLLAAIPPGALPVRESSLRLVRWTGSSQVEVPFALHDWTAAGDALGDSDGDLDANDELLFLADLTGATATYLLYFDVTDKTPASHSKTALSAGGSGIGAVYLDGTQQAAGYLRLNQGGQTLFDLMLVDSIPFWNHTSYFTHESSAIGPRINNVVLPGGTKVMSTVNHTTGSPAGDLVHTIRLGPLRLDGNFSITSSENAFFQPRLVSAIAHSAVRAHARPLAAVVVIDAELYCDEDKKCVPAKDYGDVRLVGYLFSPRGGNDEVLMRWRVSAAMSGAGTIAAGTQSSYSEEYALASYLIEGYTEAQFPSLIDIDTVRVQEKGTGTVTSGTFDTGASEARVCKDTDSWILMSDTDAPYGGVLALVPEGTPVKNGALTSAWRGCWIQDGPGALELNGFQSEWHLAHPTFQSWGSSASDTLSYAYWIYAYPHPASGSDHAPASTTAGWVRTPPSVTQVYRAKP